MNYTIILAPKDEGRCYVCTASLIDYLDSLNKDFYDYEVQRGIVRNPYLDTLTDTINKRELIPPITLVTKDSPNVDGQNLDVTQTDILDGLQRTFRLWAYYRIKQIIENNQIPNYRVLIDFMKNDYEGMMLLDYDFIKPKILKMYFSENGEQPEMIRRIERWKEYPLVFYIWFNLNEKETINKMLELNAGQKTVSSTHQYELLFLHFFNAYEVIIPLGMEIFRAKEASNYKRKNRERGQFQLSTLIVAYISFIKRNPVRVNPVNELNKQSEIVESGLQIEEYFSPTRLSLFLEQVLLIDSLLCSYKTNDVEWLGKDTTLAGIYGAFGSYLEKHKLLDNDLEPIIELIRKRRLNFDYEGFQIAYKEMYSMTVNVGHIVRKGIFLYTLDSLEGKKSSWNQYFK